MYIYGSFVDTQGSFAGAMCEDHMVGAARLCNAEAGAPQLCTSAIVQVEVSSLFEGITSLGP